MIKIILLLTFSMSTMLLANMPEQHRMDRERHFQEKVYKHTNKREHNVREKYSMYKHTRKRTFRTSKEFKHHKRRHKNMKYVNSLVRGTKYMRDRYNEHHARGYRHYRDSWYEAYHYDRASFYDRHGYFMVTLIIEDICLKVSSIDMIDFIHIEIE